MWMIIINSVLLQSLHFNELRLQLYSEGVIKGFAVINRQADVCS